MNAGIGASQINSPQEPDPVHRDVELKENQTALTSANDLAIRRALESTGVEFIDENGGGPGVRLRKRQQKKGSRRE
jgi:hypothetical protein